MIIEEINILTKLDHKKQLTYAYLTCERFLPNCLYFSQNYNFGDSNIFLQAVNLIYDSIFQIAEIDTLKLEQLQMSIYENTPNTNNFTTFYATIAMYSGGIIYETLNLLKPKEFERVIKEITMMSIEAIDCFIQERDDMDMEDDNFEEKIFNDSLMQKELIIQKGIVGYLSKIDNVEKGDVNTLIKLQETNKVRLVI